MSWETPVLDRMTPEQRKAAFTLHKCKDALSLKLQLELAVLGPSAQTAEYRYWELRTLGIAREEDMKRALDVINATSDDDGPGPWLEIETWAEDIGWATWRFARACMWLAEEKKIKLSGPLGFTMDGKHSASGVWPAVSKLSQKEITEQKNAMSV